MSFLARVTLWRAFLPLACASLAAQASAPASQPRGPAAADAEETGASVPLAQVDRELDEIDALLATAHFHTALAVAGATRDWLDRIGEDPQLGARQARLELMAATAEVALGRRARALRSLVRALRADPDLALAEGEASPKLLELLREARRRSGIAEPAP